MTFRRVVVSHDTAGRSILASDGLSPRAKTFVHTPGFATALMWGTDGTPAVPQQGPDPVGTTVSFAPAVGGTRFLIVSFAPDAVMMDPAFDFGKAGAEHLAETPGIADKFEPDSPGFHTTDTVDYGIVLTGAITLELDDGKTVDLEPHDVIVQTGTRHAWRNKGSVPASVAFVLVGAKRDTI